MEDKPQKNERQPQKNGRWPLKKWKTTLKKNGRQPQKNKMEDDPKINGGQMEDDQTKNWKDGRRQQQKMEDDLNRHRLIAKFHYFKNMDLSFLVNYGCI